MIQSAPPSSTVFNPMQLQLLRMFSYVKTEEQMRDIKKALCDYFFKKVEEGMDILCESGDLGAEQERHSVLN